MKGNIIFYLLLLGLIGSCEKALNEVEEYPIVELTLEKDLGEEGLIINAQVISTGRYEILDKGIAWMPSNGMPSYQIGPQASISEGAGLKVGEKFEFHIDRNLWPGKRYNFRFYSKLKSGIIYSDPVGITSVGTKKQNFQVHTGPPAPGLFVPDEFGVNTAITVVRGEKVFVSLPNLNFLCYNTTTDEWKTLDRKFYAVGADDKHFYMVPYTPFSLVNPLVLFDPITEKMDTLIEQAHSSFFRGLFDFALGERLYLGAIGSNSLIMWELNSRTKNLRRLNDLPFVDPGVNPFIAPSLLRIDDQIYVVQSNNGRNFFWKYDVDTDKWERKADFPGVGTHHFWHGVLDGKIYCGGSFYNQLPNDFITTSIDPAYWSYDPSKDQWTHEGWIPITDWLTLLNFRANGRLYAIYDNYKPVMNMYSFKE